MPGSTDRLLDVLDRLDVPATFFCVGRNAERHPALLRRIAEAGHAVGSHSLTHPHPRDLTPRQVRVEYETGRLAVEQALGAPVVLFRPPHGHLSVATVPLLRELRPWLWSRDPEDWRPGVRREHVEQVVGQSADGDVVLLHDWVEQPAGPASLDRSATIDAVPGVVAAVRSRGLAFTRLPA
jgi:peptidoglycan/xylan/chitin deacetylase (PgdA/CDA1 family)